MFRGGEEERRRKRRKIFGEGKNIFGEENIWRRKKLFCGGKDERRRKRRLISLRSKDWRRLVDRMVWVAGSKVLQKVLADLKQGTLTGEGGKTKRLATKMDESVLDKKGC